MTIIVVGAGAAGLSVARGLVVALEEKVVLIESKREVGGRISTERDANNDVLLERGPWRIPASHNRVLSLCRKHNITLHRSTPPLPSPKMPDVVPGLSIWDSVMRESLDPGEADRFDRSTAYPDETRAASGSSPYVYAGQYFIASDGLDQITKGLCDQFIQSGGDLLLDTRVTNIVKRNTNYMVTVSTRRGHNDFATRKMSARLVVICAPPRTWTEWSVSAQCRSTLDAVTTCSLYHVYAKGHSVGSKRDVPIRHALVPATGQRIPSQYANEWFQVAYTSGRLADFWYRMRLSRPAEFSKLLGYPLKAIRGFYWQHAFHTWRPVFGFDLERAVSLSVEPNPSELPNLYFANESHSSHQAWIEGALEMADRVLDRILHHNIPLYPRAMPKEWVVCDGWVLDVSKWKKVHPGSAAALNAHLKEDVSGLFGHIGHSHVAHATVHSLKHRPSTSGTFTKRKAA